MNITSKVWNFTKTGAKAHCFGLDGTALCRSSIKAPATEMMTKEEARKTVLSGPGLSFCEACEGKFQGILNIQGFDWLEAEQAAERLLKGGSTRRAAERVAAPAAPVTSAPKIAKVKPEIAPELVEALRTLRLYPESNPAMPGIGQAIVILDNAGVFAAIDAAAQHDGAPGVSECTCNPAATKFDVHRAGCSEGPAPELCGGVDRHGNRCTRPVQHLGYCFEGPAPECTCPPSWVDMHHPQCPQAPASETVQCGHCNGDYRPKADGTLRKHACWRYDVDRRTVVYGPLDIHGRGAANLKH